jgi:hypothetical protein
MTDPRNIAHDKKVLQEKRHHGIIGSQPPSTPGKKPHQEPHPGDHGPDPDEPVDKTESGDEP